MSRRRRLAGPVLVLLSACLTFAPAAGQTEGRAALEKFYEWKRLPANTELRFGDALTKYRQELIATGASEAAADRTIRRIVAYDEAELYNRMTP